MYYSHSPQQMELAQGIALRKTCDNCYILERAELRTLWAESVGSGGIEKCTHGLLGQTLSMSKRLRVAGASDN